MLKGLSSYACFRNSVRDPGADMARREGLLRQCLDRDADGITSMFAILEDMCIVADRDIRPKLI